MGDALNLTHEIQRRRMMRSALDAEIYALEEKIMRVQAAGPAVSPAVASRVPVPAAELSIGELIQRRNELNRAIDKAETRERHRAWRLRRASLGETEAGKETADGI